MPPRSHRDRTAMSKAPAFCLAAFMACMGPAEGLADAPRIAAPEPIAWSVSPEFAFSNKSRKTRQSLSGIACPAPSGAARLCTAVFDEGVEARFVVIDGNAMIPKPDQIVLLTDGKDELDAEGAA